MNHVFNIKTLLQMLVNQTAPKSEERAAKNLWSVKLISLVILSNIRQTFTLSCLCLKSIDETDEATQGNGAEK